MQKRNFTSYFLVFFIISLLLIGASKIGFLNPIDSLFKDIFSPIQGITYQVFTNVTGFGQNSEIQALKAQNLILTQKLVDQNKLIGDNKALRDQFQTENPKSQTLLPADVVAAPGFVPGFSVPESLILNRGTNDGVKLGNTVVYQNNLVGKVTQVLANSADVTLVTNSSSQFTAQTTETNAQGIVKGQGGGELILDNVVLSDNLKKGDFVLSSFSSDLIVGKVVSVSKNPSDLFQKAQLQSLVDFNKLTKVFVVVN